MEINGTANCRRRESGVAGWWRPSLSATQPCSACICPTRLKEAQNLDQRVAPAEAHVTDTADISAAGAEIGALAVHYVYW